MRHSVHLHLPFHTHHRQARYDVDMTQGSITKHLINFSLPLLLGNLFQQLYNMVDTWVVGNYVSNEAFSAVGTVGPVINTLIGFFLGLSSGAGVVISQYYGAGREEKVRQAVHTALMLTLVLGVVFTAAGIAMTPLMLQLMKTPAEVAPEQAAYLRIYFAGVMGLLLYNMGSGILRAVGDSRRPFYFLVVSAVLNTVLDLLFVIKFHMGVEGVAYATIIAQAVSALLTLWVLMRAEGGIQLELRALRLTWSVLRQIVAVGIPAALQMAITAFSNVFVQSYINYFGPDCMSGWTAYTKVDQLVILPVQSISMANTTFVGQNLGVGDTPRAKKGVRISLWLSVAVTAVLLIPVLLFAPDLTAFFNSKAEVVSYGALLLRLLSPFYFFFCINQIYAGALRGAGNSQMPMWIMLGSFVVFRQIYLYIMSNYISNEIIPIALSYPAGWFVCSVATLLYYHHCKFDSHRLVGD
ncbi:MAG: MATE family efflux transporter [Clostridiales bacterium]|nr:MATE family efflux transporter [Clostridiales bacterium]